MCLPHPDVTDTTVLAKQTCYTIYNLEANNLTDVPYAEELAQKMTKVINWLIYWICYTVSVFFLYRGFIIEILKW